MPLYYVTMDWDWGTRGERRRESILVHHKGPLDKLHPEVLDAALTEMAGRKGSAGSFGQRLIAKITAHRAWNDGLRSHGPFPPGLEVARVNPVVLGRAEA